VEQFEQAIADFVGSKYCIAISNGTMADAVAVAAMKEKYGIKRVVVPALTFIAQPNSVRYNNLEVVFADVGDDWQMDILKYDQEHSYNSETLFFITDLMGRVSSRPVPVYHFIEDACEAFGSFVDGKKFSGTYGKLGTYSFFPSHTISTGEGGAIVTDDLELALLCRSLRAHGFRSMSPFDKFSFPIMGFNARMTTMQAVIGIAVMGHISEYIYNRSKIMVAMQDVVGGFYDREGDTMIIPHGFPIQYESETARNGAMGLILAAGIECRKFFSCIPTDEEPYSKDNVLEFPNAQRIAHTHLYVPCHQNMTLEDVDYIAKVVKGIGGRV
jgi:dTDP-4-amino-4,6-dideoxygalactose transaminase